MEKILTFIAENKKRELEEAQKIENVQKIPDLKTEEKEAMDLTTSIIPFPILSRGKYLFIWKNSG